MTRARIAMLLFVAAVPLTWMALYAWYVYATQSINCASEAHRNSPCVYRPYLTLLTDDLWHLLPFSLTATALLLVRMGLHDLRTAPRLSDDVM